jgi:hypothetical protein
MGSQISFISFFIGVIHGRGGFAKTIATPSARSCVTNAESWLRAALATLSSKVRRATTAGTATIAATTKVYAIRFFQRSEYEAPPVSGVCREFVTLCRSLNLFSEAIVAIDGSKFKAVNNRDKSFTDRKLEARMQQLEESIARYLTELGRADREPYAARRASRGGCPSTADDNRKGEYPPHPTMNI